MSIEASATFTVMEPETMSRMFTGELHPDRDFFIYSRHFNCPQSWRQMDALESTKVAYCTSSGMCAISSALLQLCPEGSHIVASSCFCGSTHSLLSHFLPRSCSIRNTFVDISNIDEVRDAIRVGDTKVLYMESVSIPTLTIVDVLTLNAVAHEKNVLLFIDNTRHEILDLTSCSND
ncbi:Methionine gamma-lyase protein [Dioscorea alata]|uniref:Methionine gamma-lyase protein n=2 Tax=Dioscorea alata TaxID=55571 RepID=A0ACB7WNM2_DIOAL|nr:Methionine gamma-lyase protein [Dioscorea alata]KAH7689944.1 Methionine gamma-lyase protein [Dioscorea alata]